MGEGRFQKWASFFKLDIMEHTFFKDGEYEAVGGIFIRNDLKKFFQNLKNKGLNPVGLKVDDESFNLEIIVERNQAYIDMYEKDKKQEDGT